MTPRGSNSTFIIDPWFSGIIVLGLLFSIFYRNSKIPSIAAMIVLLALVFFQTLQKEKALEFGREYARSFVPGDGFVNPGRAGFTLGCARP